MANKPTDREVINLRERPLSTDINKLQSYQIASDREHLGQIIATRTNFGGDISNPMPPGGSAGFFGSAFRVRAALPLGGPAFSVAVLKGRGLFNSLGASEFNIGGISGVDDISRFMPLELTANELIAVPAADPVNPRLDIIEVKVDRRYTDATSRDILDTGTGIFAPGLVNKTLTYNQDGQSTINGVGSINYKVGTPAAVPVAPATTAGYVKISEVLVPALAVTILDNTIKDTRRMLFQSGIMHFAVDYTVSAGPFLTMNSLSAPPGVQVTAFAAALDTVNIRVLAGNTANFLSLAMIGTTLGASGPGTSLSSVAAAPAVLGDQVQAGAGSPSVPLAVGQSITSFTLTHSPAVEAHRGRIFGMYQL